MSATPTARSSGNFFAKPSKSSTKSGQTVVLKGSGEPIYAGDRLSLSPDARLPQSTQRSAQKSSEEWRNPNRSDEVLQTEESPKRSRERGSKPGTPRGKTSLASTQSVSQVHLIGNNSEREPFMKPLASPRFCHMDEVFVAIGLHHRWYRSMLIQTFLYQFLLAFLVALFQFMENVTALVDDHENKIEPCCRQHEEKFLHEALIPLSKTYPVLVEPVEKDLFNDLFYLLFIVLLFKITRQTFVLIELGILLVVLIMFLIPGSWQTSETLHGLITIAFSTSDAISIMTFIIVIEQVAAPFRKYIIIFRTIGHSVGFISCTIMLSSLHHILAAFIPLILIACLCCFLTYMFMPNSPVYHLIMNDIEELEKSIKNIIKFDFNCLNCVPEQAAGMVDDVMFNVFESGQSVLDTFRRFFSSMPLFKDMIIYSLIAGQIQVYGLKEERLFGFVENRCMYSIWAIIVCCPIAYFLSECRMKTAFHVSLAIIFIHSIHYAIYSELSDNQDPGLRHYAIHFLADTSSALVFVLQNIMHLYIVERCPKGAIVFMLIFVQIWITFLKFSLIKFLNYVNGDDMLMVFITVTLPLLLLCLRKRRFPLVCYFDERLIRYGLDRRLPKNPSVHKTLPVVAPDRSSRPPR